MKSFLVLVALVFVMAEGNVFAVEVRPRREFCCLSPLAAVSVGLRTIGTRAWRLEQADC